MYALLPLTYTFTCIMDSTAVFVHKTRSNVIWAKCSITTTHHLTLHRNNTFAQSTLLPPMDVWPLYSGYPYEVMHSHKDYCTHSRFARMSTLIYIRLSYPLLHASKALRNAFLLPFAGLMNFFVLEVKSFFFFFCLFFVSPEIN